MKIKRDDTEESRRYWQFLEENSQLVAAWPEWKRGARAATPSPPEIPMSATPEDVLQGALSGNTEAK